MRGSRLVLTARLRLKYQVGILPLKHVSFLYEVYENVDIGSSASSGSIPVPLLVDVSGIVSSFDQCFDLRDYDYQ